MNAAGPRAAAVDAVMVAYNSATTLRACVEPLSRLPWVSVTVVDNASPDDSAGSVADLPVRIVEAPRNGGFAYGCNLGIAGGTAEFVLLLNPDAHIDAASLRVLVDALRAEPRLGGIGPRVLDESGRVAWSQRRFPRLRSTYAQALLLHRAAPQATWSDEVVRDPAAYERLGTPDWLSGACLLLRREAVEAVNGLDEGFFLYSEETDLFRRLAAAGWRAGYEPRATARHVGGVSTPPGTTKQVQASSRVRYARKHHGPAVALLEAVGVGIGAVARAAIWLHRPARARAHVVAARAALRAACASATG
jgi:N-acetylglucosaminyl-diphospho-decaprenol L-rhamnosyltransferase